MAKNSSIEWTDHTFNPWWGCTKVSPGCNNCYAETWAKRVGENVWGAKQQRRFFSEKHWSEPLKWNAEAKEEKRRKRVFCASMADVFELRSELDCEREKLWALIAKTPWLDWLLLTKRPQNISKKAPWTNDWPPNVWIGTTAEDQKRADERIPILLRHPAQCRFLSCEPLIGEVDLSKWLNGQRKHFPIDWVIAGGESGPKSRPMLPDWPRKLRDQCHNAGVSFHFKQWGHWAPSSNDKVGKTIFSFKDTGTGKSIFMAAVGKKVAGRSLDGATWDEIPRGVYNDERTVLIA